MSRYPKGVTLTPEERALVQPVAPPTDPASSGSDPVPAPHAFSLALPDGTACPVTATRTGGHAYRFVFGPPLDQHRWLPDRLDSVPAIEAKAKALLPDVLEQARQAEVQAMQRKPLPPGSKRRSPDTGPEMDARNADRFGGKYAACLQNASGRLIRIGPVHEKPEAVAREIRSGQHDHLQLRGAQQILIGICNRAAQRWQEAHGLADPVRRQADPPPTQPPNPPDPAPSPTGKPARRTVRSRSKPASPQDPSA